MSPRKSIRRTTVGEIDRDVLAYTAGRDLELDLALVEADGLGSAAHVTMLSRLPLKPRLFTPAERKRVIRELVRVLRLAARGAFRIRPEDQDVHLAIERVLTERLGPLGRRVHTARSRNDQVAVDLRLFAKRELLDAGSRSEMFTHGSHLPWLGTAAMPPSAAALEPR